MPCVHGNKEPCIYCEAECKARSDNPVVKRLFDQAANKEFPTCISSIHPNELERFAKLLVQECVAVIDPKTGDKPYKDQTQEEFWKNQSVYLIKQHFGIE